MVLRHPSLARFRETWSYPCAANWWLSYWSDNMETPGHKSSQWYLGIYALITVGTLLTNLGLKIYYVYATQRASTSMHEVSGGIDSESMSD